MEITHTQIAAAIGMILWDIAYILIIRRTFIDKSPGMPVVALVANFSWEFVFSFVFPDKFLPQRLVNISWLLLDILIAAQFLYYGKKLFTKGLPDWLFYPAFALMLGLSFVLVRTFTIDFNDVGGLYSGFSINALMSALFLERLLRTQSIKGQSLYIAISKMVGTALAAFHFYASNPEKTFLTAIFVSIMVFDLLYTAQLYRELVFAGKKPFSYV